MKPHRIELGEIYDGWDRQWVEIKPWMSFAASARIEAKRFAASGIGGVEDIRANREDAQISVGVEASPAEYAAELIDQQVLDWHVMGYDDQQLPRGRVGVLSDMAPVDVIDVIIQKMEEYYKALRPNLNGVPSA